MSTRRQSQARNPLPDQREQQRNLFLQTLQAPNPSYNITTGQALAAAATLKAMGFVVDDVVLIQTMSAPADSEVTLAQARERIQALGFDDIPADTPLYFNIASNGELYELAPLVEQMQQRPFNANHYREFANELKDPFTDPNTKIFNIKAVADATTAALEALIDQHFSKA